VDWSKGEREEERREGGEVCEEGEEIRGVKRRRSRTNFCTDIHKGSLPWVRPIESIRSVKTKWKEEGKNDEETNTQKQSMPILLFSTSRFCLLLLISSVLCAGIKT